MSSHGKRSGRGFKPTPVPTQPVARSSRPVRTPSSGSGGARRGRRNGPLLWLTIVGTAAIVVAVLAVTVLRPGTAGRTAGTTASRSGGPTAAPARSLSAGIGPPNATPLSSPPAEPAGSGVTATITTTLGKIVIQLFDQSAPVAATNFLNLAQAGFYDGVTFHRLVPGFVIQGGDPAGNGSGGPGYTIQDEPVVGTYARGIVAMARTSQPNSQGSQFFIVLDDSARQALDQPPRAYVIFGKVTEGMDVVDKIAAMPNAGGQSNAAINPVVMDTVTVSRP